MVEKKGKIIVVVVVVVICHCSCHLGRQPRAAQLRSQLSSMVVYDFQSIYEIHLHLSLSVFCACLDSQEADPGRASSPLMLTHRREVVCFCLS